MPDKLITLREAAAAATMLMRSCALVSVAAARSDYHVEIISDPDMLRERLEALSPNSVSTLFQRPGWLSSWYATVAVDQSAEPLIVQVFDRDSGAHVLTLPLIRTHGGGLCTIEFADLGVTDYNAPILGQAAPVTVEGAAALWRQILAALPECDLVHFRKMPVSIGGRPNPLALLRGVCPSSCPGFSTSMPDDWESYLRSLAKKFRKELGRSLRLFEAEGATRFWRLDDAGRAERVLKIMSEQQRNRLEEKGYAYVLDEQSYNRFYASLVAGGLEDGTTVLTALMAGDEVVAALLGVTDGTSFAMVRLSHASGDWLRVGVGRLIIERTLHELHAQGCRHFDFTIGDYPYKTGFGVEPHPLLDLVTARSWRGIRVAAGDIAKARVKRALGTIGISVAPKAVKERYRKYHAAD